MCASHCRIQTADPEYKRAFDEELAAFKQRIRRRAKEKVEEQMEELRREEEEERRARLGPGGLDPAEVFESLPKVLQECFESQDIGKLQQAIREMPEEEARLHMKRCVDSGLWKPAADDPNTNPVSCRKIIVTHSKQLKQVFHSQEDGFRRREAADGDGGDAADEDGGEPVYAAVGGGEEGGNNGGSSS